MVWKPVKTAVKRHGGGIKEGADAPIACTSERIAAIEPCGPATIVEGTATVLLSGGQGPIQALSGGGVGISQRCKDPSLMSFGECYLEPARIAEASPIADPIQPQSE
jgi:hypothetical protein